MIRVSDSKTFTVKTVDLQFFPTSEGFYDYKKDQYIYQYKDHLGNVRVSFARNSAGALEITDNNDYYPFGMNHLKSGNAFFGQNSYKSYKYNGKELQETGMYDYGARMYMADIGKWGVVDPLAETTRRFSTYNYALNNPISFIDPDGRKAITPTEGLQINSSSDSAWWGYSNSYTGSKSNLLLSEMNNSKTSGGGGSLTVGDIMNKIGFEKGNLNSYIILADILNGTTNGIKSILVEQLEKKYKLDGKSDVSTEGIMKMISEVPELERLFTKGDKLARFSVQKYIFNEDGSEDYGVTHGVEIKISIIANNTNLQLAYTVGHELIHVFLNGLSKTIRPQVNGSWRAEMALQEVEAHQWNFDMGDRNSFFLRNKSIYELRNVYGIEYKPKYLYLRK